MPNTAKDTGAAQEAVTTKPKPPKLTGDYETDALQAFTFYVVNLPPDALRRVLAYATDKAGYTMTPRDGDNPSK